VVADQSGVVIVGERVTLRALRPDEVEDEWREMLSADSQAILVLPDETEFKARLNKSGRLMDRVIDLAIDVDGSSVGRIQTFLPDDRIDQPDVYNIGIGVRAEQRGHGYAADAIELFARWLHDEAGAGRVEGRTAPENVAMQRVFERLGWARDGELLDGGRPWLMFIAPR
jgi:RimJ/RimL family protein N-acetyltransferase